MSAISPVTILAIVMAWHMASVGRFSFLGPRGKAAHFDKSIELAVEVPAETKLAIERAATSLGMSVSELVQDAFRKLLVEVDSGSEKPLN